MGNGNGDGNGRLIPDMSQYVTFRWLMGACVGLCLGGAAVTTLAMVHMNERFEKKANAVALAEVKKLYQDDIRWIKECMVKKCWDNP